MATPRASQPRDLEQRFKDLQSQIDKISSVVLKQRQLSVTDGDFVVSGGGSVIVQDGGTVTVDGTALSAVSAAVGHDECLNVLTNATDSVKMAVSITVPAGYSRALVLGTGMYSAVNNTGSSNFLRGHVVINGVSIGHDDGSDLVTASNSGIVHAAASRLITGLSGGSIAVQMFAYVQSGASWGSNSFGNLDALIVFLH